MAEALLLRATFYLLIGSANAAKPDLDKVISLKEANEASSKCPYQKRHHVHAAAAAYAVYSGLQHGC